jgi:hypothetical protein
MLQVIRYGISGHRVCGCVSIVQMLLVFSDVNHCIGGIGEPICLKCLAGLLRFDGPLKERTAVCKSSLGGDIDWLCRF